MGFKQKHLLFLVFILGLSALVYYAHWAQQFHFEEEEQSPKIALLFRRLISRLLNYTGEKQERSKSSVHPGATPDVFHFFMFDTTQPLSFVAATCILSAYLNHGPEFIVLHTNTNLTQSKYLQIVESVVGTKFQVRYDPKARPSHVYGQRLSSTYHATDVARILVLSREGGVALDLDTFVVKPLRSFYYSGTGPVVNDCVLGWPEGQFIGTQVIVARPNSYFLRLWLLTYKDYRPSAWYYNAAEAPTKQILVRRPDLITRVKEKFGVQNLADKLYLDTDFNWGDFYTIHLLARHRDYLAKKDVEQSKILNFDENNIQDYDKSFGEIARSIWNHPSVKNHWK